MGNAYFPLVAAQNRFQTRVERINHMMLSDRVHALVLDALTDEAISAALAEALKHS